MDGPTRGLCVALIALALGLTGTAAYASEGAYTVSDDVVGALGAVALSGDAAAVEGLADRLFDYEVTPDRWRHDFQAYFGTGTFTIALGQFFEATIAVADEREQPRLALISALCAVEAVKSALPRATGLPAAYESLSTAFRWLEYASPALDTQGRAAVAGALTEAMGSGALDAFARNPQQYAFYVQAALTLADYADASGRGEIAQLLGLPPAAQTMWRSFGILVFDNGAFGGAHYASLASLLSAIPRPLHAIRAIVVPEAAGIPAGTAFATQGQVVYLPAIAMDEYTSPYEFIVEDGPV
ncbi:MAG: hypothetical protein FJY92_07280, partial [Candidatus Hydrogenedentes bacterium]|nr:hypothetical protein [Candidatus Hydrogenedentota bacterium]